MEAKDLRIGNITSAGVVSEILQDRFYVHDGESSLKSTWFDIQPIPITEEWLLKFGFEYEDSKKELLSKHSVSFYIPYNQLRCYGHPNNIKYIHQLQNLYFTLKGEELTIKK
jgi:hypothetical protein